jgi:hypothetical protein
MTQSLQVPDVSIHDMPCAAVRFVKELYPRLKPIDEVIERYRDALANLPPIVVARDGVLLDGYHRWQAHLREHAETIRVENLGDMTDAEILRESYRRNAKHGEQMSKRDKIAAAEHLYLNLGGTKDERYAEIAAVLSLGLDVAAKYCAAARQTEKTQQQDRAWELWLDCVSQLEIAERLDVPQTTVSDWLTKKERSSEIGSPPESLQHFDVWNFATTDRDGGGQQSYFRRAPAASDRKPAMGLHRSRRRRRRSIRRVGHKRSTLQNGWAAAYGRPTFKVISTRRICRSMSTTQRRVGPTTRPLRSTPTRPNRTRTIRRSREWHAVRACRQAMGSPIRRDFSSETTTSESTGIKHDTRRRDRSESTRGRAPRRDPTRIDGPLDRRPDARVARDHRSRVA